MNEEIKNAFKQAPNTSEGDYKAPVMQGNKEVLESTINNKTEGDLTADLPDLNITEEQLLRLAREANAVQRGLPSSLTICGKKWPLRTISMKQGLEISNLAFDAVAIQEEIQKEGLSARKMKRLNARLHQLGAKMAAHYILGKKRRWIPFLYAYTWRKIYNETEEVSATINSEQTIKGKDKDFYLANLENLKFQLVLSMRQVGDAAEEMRKRRESAENMLDEDALPKKEEGSKLGARSKRQRTTKR